MALILNIETSADYCSVTLAEKGEIINSILEKKERSHASLLAVSIDNLFKGSNIPVHKIDAVAISQGPGSYTGLRIGTSTAKGICYGLNKPLIAVDTMRALSWGAKQKLDVKNGVVFCPMLDARRMEVYSATYNDQLENINPIHSFIFDAESITEFEDKKAGYVYFGSGIDKFKTLINPEEYQFVEDIYPHSDYLVEFSYKAFQNNDFADTAYFEPFYLKEFIATTPKRKVI